MPKFLSDLHLARDADSALEAVTLEQLTHPDAVNLSDVWKWNNSTAVADPGAGYISTDTVTFNNTTKVCVSKTSSTGVTGTWWAAAKAGDSLLIVDQKRAGALRATLTGPAVDHATWIELSVTAGADSTSTNPAPNDQTLMVWLPPPTAMDHGALTGLGDDDHPQYLNNVRGDTRYEAVGVAVSLVTAHEAAANPHPTYLTQAEADPLYLNQTEGDARYVLNTTDSMSGALTVTGSVTSKSLLVTSLVAGDGLMFGGGGKLFSDANNLTIIGDGHTTTPNNYLQIGTIGFKAPNIYGRTTTGGANVNINGSSIMMRSTSSLRYKTDVQDATEAEFFVRALRPVTFIDLGQQQRYLAYQADPLSFEDDPAGIPVEPHRYLGFIAEEIAAIADPLTETIVEYDKGLPEAVNYDRITACLVDVSQKLLDRVDILEARVADLSARLATLEVVS